MSAVGVGVVMWLLGAMRLCFRLTFVESLLFGAVISATDTVTVLNIFKMLRRGGLGGWWMRVACHIINVLLVIISN